MDRTGQVAYEALDTFERPLKPSGWRRAPILSP